jgi:hypothetical protein
LDLNNIYKRDIQLINELSKELEIEYELDFMLNNFKSMFMSIEATRTRVIGVLKIDEKKTKRIQIKTVSHKLKNKEEIVLRLSVFISMFRQIKAIKEIEEIEKGLKLVNMQLLYNDYSYFKEFL